MLCDNEIKYHLEDIASLFFEKPSSGKYSLYDGLLRAEVSENNMNKLDLIMQELIVVIHFTYSTKTIKLFNPITGEKQLYSHQDAFTMLNNSSAISMKNISKYYNNDIELNSAIVQSKFVDIEPFSVKSRVNNIIRDYFTDITLIIVHRTKGYMIIGDVSSLYCNRITSGNLRCKIKI